MMDIYNKGLSCTSHLNQMTLTCWENKKAGLLIKLTAEFKQCVNDFSLSLQLPCTPTNSHGPLVGSPSASLGLCQKNPHWHPVSLIAFAPCPSDDRDNSATTSQFPFPPRTFNFNYLISTYFFTLSFYSALDFYMKCHFLSAWQNCGSVAVAFGFSKQAEALKERTYLLS